MQSISRWSWPPDARRACPWAHRPEPGESDGPYPAHQRAPRATVCRSTAPSASDWAGWQSARATAGDQPGGAAPRSSCRAARCAHRKWHRKPDVRSSNADRSWHPRGISGSGLHTGRRTPCRPWRFSPRFRAVPAPQASATADR